MTRGTGPSRGQRRAPLWPVTGGAPSQLPRVPVDLQPAPAWVAIVQIRGASDGKAVFSARRHTREAGAPWGDARSGAGRDVSDAGVHEHSRRVTLGARCGAGYGFNLATGSTSRALAARVGGFTQHSSDTHLYAPAPYCGTRIVNGCVRSRSPGPTRQSQVHRRPAPAAGRRSSDPCTTRFPSHPGAATDPGRRPTPTSGPPCGPKHSPSAAATA